MTEPTATSAASSAAALSTAPVPPAATDAATLHRSLAAGVAWTAAARSLGQAVAWASTFVVARLLNPDAYGVVGMATVYINLLQMLAELGLGSAIVARRDMTRQTAAQLHTIAAGVGVLGALLGVATANLVGRFYGEPRLPAVLSALSATFVIQSLRTVPWALLQRDLRFKRLAGYDAVQTIVLALATVGLAIAGFGYWTLVGAQIISAVLSTGLALGRHPIGFARPDWASLRPTLVLGGDLVAQRIAWYAYSNSDVMVAGRILGPGPLGLYTMAFTLAQTATSKIGAMLFGLTGPVFARMQDDRAQLSATLMRLTELLVLVVAPLTTGLALVAPEFVRLVMGAQWTPMIPALQLLSAYAAWNVAGVLPNQVLPVIGAARSATWFTGLQLVVMPIAFFVGARTGGVTGLAVAWVTVHPVLAFAMLTWTLRVIGIPTRHFLWTVLWPAASACLVMAGAVSAVRALLAAHIPMVVLLVAEIMAGALAYGGTLLLLHRERLTEAVRAVRRLRSGQA